MRLLVLTPEHTTWGGGIATFYRDFLRSAAEAQIEVRVIEGSAYSSSSSRARSIVDGVSTEQLERHRFIKWHERLGHLSALPGFRRHLAAAWAIWEQALEGPEFDVVEATDWGLLCVPPVIAGLHPTVIQAHASCGQISRYDTAPGDEASDILVRMVELAVFNAATEVQTYASANSRFWTKEAGRAVSMIRPAWSSPSTPVATPVSREGLVVGRLQSWKGPETLCQAALLLTGSDAPAVHWIGREVDWPGGGVSASAHLAQKFPSVWGTRVVHEHQVTPDQVRRRQAAALFNLVPSTWDVFNFTAIEAMASGRPTIVSSGAGASELIENGENGFVYPAEDAYALAGVIESVLTLTSRRQVEIGDNARSTVARELDPARITEKRMEKYRAAMAAHAAKSTKMSEWLVQACSPPPAQVPEGEFLWRLPFGMLTRHVTRRALNKVMPR